MIAERTQPRSTCNLESDKRLCTPHTKPANVQAPSCRYAVRAREAERQMRSSLSRSSSAVALPLKPIQAFPPIRLPYGEGAGLDVLASCPHHPRLPERCCRPCGLRAFVFLVLAVHVQVSLNSLLPSSRVHGISPWHAVKDTRLPRR